MREYIDSRDIANTVMMLSTAFSGTVAVVEGITDKRLYGKFFSKDVEVVIAHSKSNVRSAVRETYFDRGFKSVIGIMDADLDYLEGRRRSPPLFLTDTRDSEGLMLRSGALESVIHEYCDEERMEAFVDRYGSLRDCVLEATYPLGLLMFVSVKYGLGLSFKDLDFERFIDRRTMRCDRREMIETVVSNSRSETRSDPRTIYELMKNEEEHDPWIVCRGHDMMSVLAIGLRNIFGGNNAKHISDAQLSGGFRLAFTRGDMESTGLFADTSEWCAKRNLALWSVRS